MALSGACHCGAVKYQVEGPPLHVALCHCSDCRRSAGAPMVGWAAFPEGSLTLQGEVTVFNSSGTAMRSFCPVCGSGLFYRNAEFLPGIVDIQIGTFDDPAALPPDINIQVKDRLPWMQTTHELPSFEHYPQSD